MRNIASSSSLSQGNFERLSRSIVSSSTSSPRSSTTPPPRLLSPRRLDTALLRSYSASNWVTSPRVFAPSRKFEASTQIPRPVRQARRRQPDMSDSGHESSNGDAGSGQKSMLASQRERGEGQVPPPQIKPGWFPLGYKTAVSQWWANVPAAEAEHEIMSFIPYLKKAVPTQTQTGAVPGEPGSMEDEGRPSSLKLKRTASASAKTEEDPYGPREWRSELVQLSGKNRAINEFSVHRTDEKTEQNLVMLHGYGAGLGFYYLNFEGLSRLPGWRVYALDLLGMGRSSRPPFRVKAKISKREAVIEAEDFFIDALEEWRIKRKIEKFTLLGHSLGGYLATAYALKYPGHIEKLVLASPVGIPEDPYAVQEDLPDMPAPDEQEAPADGNNFLNKRDKNEAAAAGSESTAKKPKERPYPKWLTYLWDANVSPFSIVRYSGPLGPRFVSGWTSRRFGHLPQEQSTALHTYSYSLFKQRGSGEYALAYILAPGAFARYPMIHRIAGVGRQTLHAQQQQSAGQEHGFPVVFMYGDKDWMDAKGGQRATTILNEIREKNLREAKTTEERKLENGGAKLKIIKNAGHHLYLEGWEEFNEFMRGEMEDTAAWARGRSQ